MKISTTIITLLFATLATLAHGVANIPLTTINNTGTLYWSNVNNESVEPNTPEGKPFDYPYYFDDFGDNDDATGVWVVIVAEPLSANYTYALEEANFNVINKTVTDPDFGTLNFGNIEYDDSLVSSTGESIIAPGDLTLTFDATPFSPVNSTRNINNEFGWAYDITASNLTGTGLTFTDGVLTDTEIFADVLVSPNIAFSGYSGTFSLTGVDFAFDIDEVQDINSFFGLLEDAHLVFDVAGSIPEPGHVSLIFGIGVLICLRRKRLV